VRANLLKLKARGSLPSWRGIWDDFRTALLAA